MNVALAALLLVAASVGLWILSFSLTFVLVSAAVAWFPMLDVPHAVVVAAVVGWGTVSNFWARLAWSEYRVARKRHRI